MSDTPDILHEAEVREVIQDKIEDTVGHTGAAIADVGAPSVAYTQAEAVDAADAINAILAVLRVNGLIAAS
jgi:hypothetical protein